MQVDPVGYLDSMNLYIYVDGNPLNFIDPLGLCKGDKWANMPWWEKLEKGYYYGAGIGEESAYDWAEHSVKGELWYERVYYETTGWAGGFFSSFWTPETWMATATTVVTALSMSSWAANTGPTLHYKGGEVVLKSQAGKTIGRAGIGRLPSEGKRALRIPKWARGKKLPHMHKRGPGGIGRHIPWERAPTKY